MTGEDEAKRDLLRLLESIDRNAQTSYEDGQLREGHAHRVVLGLAARCRGLFRSIYFLLKQGHAEEAAALCRTLFSDTVFLGYLLRNWRSIEKLAVRFIRDSLLAELALGRSAESHGGTVPGRGLAGIAADIAELDAYAREIGMSSVKKLPTEKTMAEAINRPEYYYFYRWASLYVHTTRVVLEARIATSSDGSLEIGTTGHDTRTWVGVAVFAGELFTFAQVAACRLLGFETAGSVESFRQHVHERLRDVAVRSGVRGAEGLFRDRSTDVPPEDRADG